MKSSERGRVRISPMMNILNLSLMKSLKNVQKPNSVKYMDMNTRSKNISSETELLYIGGVGFMFEINNSIKHNLLNPDVLTFFKDVPESEKVTKGCAFPFAKPNTSLYQSVFQKIGSDWVVCSDGILRKCSTVSCVVESESGIKMLIFHIERNMTGNKMAGIISL